MIHVRHPVTVMFLALLVVALAACGPMAAGDASRVDYRPGATYEVPAGTTLYVAAETPLGETGLTPSMLRRAGLVWIPLGIRGESANASTLVTLGDVQAPEEWQVRLWQVRLVRERPLGERDASPAYRLEAEVRVDVPASAFDLTRRVTARLHVQGGDSLPIDFLVRAE